MSLYMTSSRNPVLVKGEGRFFGPLHERRGIALPHPSFRLYQDLFRSLPRHQLMTTTHFLLQSRDCRYGLSPSLYGVLGVRDTRVPVCRFLSVCYSEPRRLLKCWRPGRVLHTETGSVLRYVWSALRVVLVLVVSGPVVGGETGLPELVPSCQWVTGFRNKLNDTLNVFQTERTVPERFCEVKSL